MKNETELLVQTAKPQLKEPVMYQVIMHNDDYTPMEFVVDVLEMFFNMERNKATQVMYEVHMTGQAICGVFSKDVAETKSDQVMEYARRHEHPLLCSIEVV
jgi:ATP-dependent Clp protease adaptor protein ClpS